MTRLRSAYAMALALSGAMAACSPPPMTDAGDTGTGNDAADMSVQPDSPITPDGGDSAVTPDGDAGSNVCRNLPIEDLATLGMMMGTDTVRYAGDNNMAPAPTTTAMLTATGIQVPNPTAPNAPCAFLTTRQRIFKYTVRTNSVLRISTTNMGTDPGFDTTLVAITACPRTSIPAANFLGCNDDDPNFGADDRRISSSFVTARQVMANSTVYIGVGGFVGADGTHTDTRREHGNFVLTVQELPVVPDGMPCDPARLTNACSDMSTCVPNAAGTNTGTCRANGSVAGARCDMAGACTGTLVCDMVGALQYCINRGVADGMPCDQFNQCGMTSSCTNLVLGANGRGVCRANGSTAGAQCATGMTCTGTGLACSTAGTTPLCLFSAPAGGACNSYDSVCASNQSCLTDGRGGRNGTCVPVNSALGAECDMPGGTCTPTGSTCLMGTTRNTCVHQVMNGQMCSAYQTCPMNSTCYLTDITDRVDGLCFGTGTAGGACDPTGMCPTGTTCSNMTNPANGRCLRTVAMGADCSSLTDPVQCPMGSACVRNAAGMSTCQALGAVGAPCRPTGSPCDGSAMCSATVIEEGVCQNAGTAGGMCIPRLANTRCPSGSFCLASSLDSGTCSAAMMEMEGPNNNADASTPMVSASTPVAIQGSLGFADVDCVRVALTGATGGHIYASVNSPSGLCPGVSADPAIDIYQDSAGGPRLLGTDLSSGAFGCPRIDGFNATAEPNFGWASNLSAGTYFVCVRNNATGRAPIPAYVLSLRTTM